ncbi:MAG: bifunctional phosphoribosylaminoimidazolecarboxamide formyltransferase/IMP cyclohydrolase [Candidatus Omnitrophica bacterium]|nr:bifunctional phosphoribosylaminoimidazolecarboxamide formyltransferase/IMP cyclohydrolase [Candidatus Omnitrophota bacterium]MCM8828051.1 bifunctional phosphoribosylaminoimidazolecarboxamide formyltransferase/IMP cyclohydrolase [Candidatus Omnitrophota bacterium]
MIKVKRALISVSDKTGLIDLARVLAKNNVEIISTGGTARAIREAGIDVKEISEFTGFPEILDGRVKTLHPFIYGGILYKRDNPSHLQQVSQHNICQIDLVVVNLYPFEKVFFSDGATDEELIENIDIGGPSMIRASAKNWKFVCVVVNPDFYPVIIEEIEKNGGISETTSRKCAAEVFHKTGYYDWLISRYFDRDRQVDFSETVGFYYKKIDQLRYGENPHQKAAWYRRADKKIQWKQLQGKQLSFNNILDMESAYRIAHEFEQPACCIIKHNNPCGAATGRSVKTAFEKALKTDPLSAFGGIIGINRQLDSETADIIKEIFFEVIIAPSFSKEAVDILSKKENLRLIEMPCIEIGEFEIKGTAGGILLQSYDTSNWDSLEVKTKRQPTEEELEALKFSMIICKHVRSNAIVLGTTDQVVGIGAGQMSRFDSTRVAVMKMKDNFKEKITPLVMASDAFFPFPDSIEVAAEAGVSAIIQPGGSLKDREVIEVCDKKGISMVFSGIRHFRH